MSWTGLPLRAHLLAFGLVCFLPALLALTYLGLSLSSAEQSRVLQQVEDGARDLQEAVTRDVDGPLRVLAALAASPSVETRNWQALQRQAEQALGGDGAAIALRTPDRQQLVNTAIPFGSRPLPVTSDPTLWAADELVFQTKRPAVSDVYIGAAARTPFVAVDFPILRGGEVAYLLTMAIPPDRFVSRFRLGEQAKQGWLAVIIGRDGRVIARSRDPDRFVGAVATDQFLRAIRETPAGHIQSTTLDGSSVRTSYVRLANEWTVVVSVPETVLNAPVRALLMVLGFVLALATFSTAIGAWAYGRLLGREIKTLAGNATRMGDHKPLVPFKQHIAEVAETQREMLGASQRIETLLAELDHRVKNTLAVVLSVVSRSVGSLRERRVIEGRIGALSRAHEALSASRWEGADFCKLITEVAKSHDCAVSCDGPNITLSPKAVVSLAQVWNELLSNARDYGALRDPGGAVSVSWRVRDGEVHVDWIEKKTSEADELQSFTPRFGLKIVALCIGRQLGGDYSLRAHEEGWHLNLHFPLVSELGVAARCVEDC